MNIYIEPAAPATETATDSAAPQAQSWRDTLPIHPAAALFPRMSSDELRELGKDIRKNGLRSSIALWQSDKGASALLLDGISRLDAVEVELGRPVRVVPRTYRRTRWSLETDEDGESVPVTNLIGEAGNTTAQQQTFILLGRDVDPWAYVTSANLHRRHLTAEQRRELIGKLIEAMPEKSNRQIAKLVNASPTTVGTKRAEMEATGDVSKLDTSTDTRGRRQPVHKPHARTRTSAPQGERADMVKAGEPVVKKAGEAEVTTIGTDTSVPMAAGAHDDIGPGSNGETERKLARLEELEVAEVPRLKAKIDLLERENQAPLSVAWVRATQEEKRAEVAKLSVEGLLRLLPDATKAALKRRVVEHLSAEDHLVALERKLHGAPPSPKTRAAFKALERVLNSPLSPHALRCVS